MTAYLLNLLDLAFTLHALECGAVEANPLMRSIPVMIAYKVIVIGALCWWLSRRPEKLARYGMAGITAIYAAINIYHLFFIFAV